MFAASHSSCFQGIKNVCEILSRARRFTESLRRHGEQIPSHSGKTNFLWVNLALFSVEAGVSCGWTLGLFAAAVFQVLGFLAAPGSWEAQQSWSFGVKDPITEEKRLATGKQGRPCSMLVVWEMLRFVELR